MNRIALQPMTPAEFESWLPRSRENFAAAKMKGQALTRAEALAVSEKAYQDLLPQGLNTPDHFLFMARNQGSDVGFVWFCARGPANNRKAYIYDVEVYEAFRGQGFGRAIMLEVEQRAREMGLKHVGLHVFGFNETAIQLYKSLDYQVTGIMMEKPI